MGLRPSHVMNHAQWCLDCWTLTLPRCPVRNWLSCLCSCHLLSMIVSLCADTDILCWSLPWYPLAFLLCCSFVAHMHDPFNGTAADVVVYDNGNNWGVCWCIACHVGSFPLNLLSPAQTSMVFWSIRVFVSLFVVLSLVSMSLAGACAASSTGSVPEHIVCHGCVP